MGRVTVEKTLTYEPRKEFEKKLAPRLEAVVSSGLLLLEKRKVYRPRPRLLVVPIPIVLLFVRNERASYAPRRSGPSQR